MLKFVDFLRNQLLLLNQPFDEETQFIKMVNDALSATSIDNNEEEKKDEVNPRELFLANLENPNLSDLQEHL